MRAKTGICNFFFPQGWTPVFQHEIFNPAVMPGCCLDLQGLLACVSPKLMCLLQAIVLWNLFKVSACSPQPPHQPDSASAAPVMEMLDGTLINASLVISLQSSIYLALPLSFLISSLWVLTPLVDLPPWMCACTSHDTAPNKQILWKCESIPPGVPGRPAAHFQEMLGQGIHTQLPVPSSLCPSPH